MIAITFKSNTSFWYKAFKIFFRKEYKHKIKLGKTYKKHTNNQLLKDKELKRYLHKILWDGKGERIKWIIKPIRFKPDIDKKELTIYILTNE